jgi:hypothetical protein
MGLVQEFLSEMGRLLGAYVPSLIGALVILLVGWLVAAIVAALVRAALRRTTWDEQLASWALGEERAKGIEAGAWVAKGVFYLIMLFVVVAFLEALGLTIVTQPLNMILITLSAYLPRVLGAGMLLLFAWLAASALRFLATKALSVADIDKRLSSKAGFEEEGLRPSKALANALYWLVFLLFLPAVLDALGMQGLLGPVQGMVDNILGFLPNIFAAGLILVVGWFVARILRRFTVSLLVAIGADRLSEQVGLATVLGKQRLSGLLGLVVYILIFIPVVVAALNALALDAITEPATNMLNMFMEAIPAIFAAAVLIGIAYVLGRLVARLVTDLLTGIGFNSVMAFLGLAREPGEGRATASQIVGYLVLVGIMLFASIEALRLLGFASVAELATAFTAFAGQVILGLFIFGLGLWLANLAAKTIRASGTAQAGLLAMASRVSILVLAGAMAVRQMGVANDIINTAFGLLLGAIAVAVALAFGLGGREIAGRELEEWLRSVRSKR